MKSDYKWLHEWELILKGKYILELGCGDGKDSHVLFELGRELVACDRNLCFLQPKNDPLLQPNFDPP